MYEQQKQIRHEKLQQKNLYLIETTVGKQNIPIQLKSMHQCGMPMPPQDVIDRTWCVEWWGTTIQAPSDYNLFSLLNEHGVVIWQRKVLGY